MNGRKQPKASPSRANQSLAYDLEQHPQKAGERSGVEGRNYRRDRDGMGMLVELAVSPLINAWE